MRSIVFILIISIFAIPLFSQSWTQVDERSISQLGKRNINPLQYITAKVNDDVIKTILWDAPNELNFNPSRDQHTLINIMMADGLMDEFSIISYQMMESGLASRYSSIRTFHGISTSDPARRIRINYTVHGLRAIITDKNGQTYIDHFQRKDKNHKIIYRRNDFSTNEDWDCLYEEKKSNNRDNNTNGFRSGDCVFRSYRLSITATGEYSNYHDAFDITDSLLVMSAMVTTVDRLNDVFEQDLTMRLILIDNVDDVFYYDATTDPFSGSSAGAMINENQTNTDAVIGSDNYDLGHIFSTGGSGLAALGVICSNGSKAKGVTGISVPEGDPFDIDYVAHEMGHQLGANHTQNNSCNRNASTAMEPGSASTIMGYAGICSPNVQNNSDAYFHAISVEEMNAEILSNSCHQVITLSNVAPVANPLTNKSIPHSTPFVLDVVANDGDGDVLTYNWEQMDHEVGSMPPSGTNTQGPMFRSIFSTTDSKRYFPNLESLSTNVPFEWEVLPTVDRNMDFRVTVRDNTFAPGCTDEQDITIDVEGNAGPFVVTSQNTATTWLESESVTITWDVANTDTAPVNCNNVDILMSYDSGLSFTSTILSGTSNDGLAIITVPLGVTSTARIMVKASDNVFFNINDQDIIINIGIPSFSINADPGTGSVCEDLSIFFKLESTSILGFVDPITLSVSDLPSGATAVIATNPLVPGNITFITIDNLDGLSGIFPIKITGVSGAITKETIFDLTVENLAIAPVLATPIDGSTGVLLEPLLSWNTTPGSQSYEYEVSTLPDGADVINSGTTTSTSVLITPELNIATTYYWRIKSTTNCSVSPWSAEWSFETGVCIIKMASDLPIDISGSGTPTIISNLVIQDKGIVTDLNIVDLSGAHTYISDLNFTLISPDNTSVDFWSSPCTNQDDFDINFDDEAADDNYPCPPINGLIYQPDNELSVFDTKQMIGNWILSIYDQYDADGGSLDDWGVEICLDAFCDLTVNDNSFVDSYGTLKSALDCAVDGDTIRLESAIAGTTINAGSGPITIDQSIVILADPNDNIKVLTNGSEPCFIIATGKTVGFVGIDIENMNSSVGVIQNNGDLTLKNVEVQAGVDKISVNNQIDSNLTIDGNCVFQ